MTGSDRRIGARELVVFYVTSIVGAGILVVPGIAARRAGPASLLAWLLLALASFPMALMFAEMSAQRPDCGGIAALLRAVLGVSAGDTASLLLVVAYVVIVPVMAISSARHVCDALALRAGLVTPLAVMFVLVSGAFCLTSVGTAARLQGLVLLTLLACLLVAVALALPSMSLARFNPFLPHGWAAVGATLPAVFWSFLGWENVSTIAEEVRAPRRSFHGAIRVAVPLIGIVYLGVTVAYLALPHTGNVLLMPTLLAGIGTSGRVLGDLFGLALIVPVTNAWMLGASRLALSAAREGLLPAALQRRSEGTGAPMPALSAVVITCVLMVGALDVLALDESFAISLSAAIFLALYIAAALATLRERRTARMSISAIATGVMAACFIPFTGTALPAAALAVAAAYATSRAARAKHVTTIMSTTMGKRQCSAVWRGVRIRREGEMAAREHDARARPGRSRQAGRKRRHIAERGFLKKRAPPDLPQ